MTRLPTRRPRSPAAVASFNVFGFPFDFAAPSPLALQFLRSLYLPFEVERTNPATTTFSLESRKTDHGRAWEVHLGEQPLVSEPTIGAALNRLEYEICLRVIEHRPDLIVLHGATVITARGAALISGPSGAGKSTLSLALAARGYRVGGDDVALLDPGTDLIRPLPRCFHLDARSRRLLGRAGLQTPVTAARHGFLTPSDLGMTEAPAVPVRWVLLLERGDEIHPRLAPLTQAEMTARMLDETRWAARSAPELLRVLGRLTGSASCFRLVGGRLRGTADLVATLLGPA